MILDDGGDATLLLILGAKRRTDLPCSRIRRTKKRRRSIRLRSTRNSIPSDYYSRKRANQVKGVSEETTTGVHRLFHVAQGGDFLSRRSM